MRQLTNIFWLAGKELKSVLGDPVMVVLILWSFVVAVMLEASGAGDTVRNAAIAILDEDNSALTRALTDALGPPWFQPPMPITPDRVQPAMDAGQIMFVLSFPPGFEADVIAGLMPAAQLGGRCHRCIAGPAWHRLHRQYPGLRNPRLPVRQPRCA